MAEHNKETDFIHAGPDRDPFTGGSSIPVYQASTFAQPDPDNPGAYDYGRSGNPTREALEKAIAEMEGGSCGFAFASGMAAITAAFFLLKAGDHVLVSEDVYGGTYRILTTLFRQWGLESDFVDTTNAGAVEKSLKSNSRAIFVESPSNPLLKITDLSAIAAIARRHGLLTMIDNTFPTPWLQRPLELGFDVVLHSATKFIGGHSDVIAGLAVVKDTELGRRLKMIQNNMGAVLGPQDCWLVLRGIKTLGVRLEYQQKSAQKLAEELSRWPRIKQVFYPGLAGHPGRLVHERQCSGAGAVLSFELADAAVARKMFAGVRLCIPAVSLGGVETILSWPARMSHAAMPFAERQRRGIGEGLLRLSAGLEHPQDIINDLKQAI